MRLTGVSIQYRVHFHSLLCTLSNCTVPKQNAACNANVCRYPHKISTIVFTNPCVIKRARRHFSIYIIGKVSLFGYVIFSGDLYKGAGKMELAHLMVEGMMKPVVLVLWRYPTYVQHRTFFL